MTDFVDMLNWIDCVNCVNCERGRSPLKGWPCKQCSVLSLCALLIRDWRTDSHALVISRRWAQTPGFPCLRAGVRLCARQPHMSRNIPSLVKHHSGLVFIFSQDSNLRDSAAAHSTLLLHDDHCRSCLQASITHIHHGHQSYYSRWTRVNTTCLKTGTSFFKKMRVCSVALVCVFVSVIMCLLLQHSFLLLNKFWTILRLWETNSDHYCCCSKKLP